MSQSYLKEFPSFDDVLPTIERFYDDSWHNDSCPSLRCELRGGDYAKLWCNYKDANLRETHGKRYTLTFYKNEDFSDDYLNLFSTDDIEEMKGYISQFLSINLSKTK